MFLKPSENYRTGTVQYHFLFCFVLFCLWRKSKFWVSLGPTQEPAEICKPRERSEGIRNLMTKRDPEVLGNRVREIGFSPYVG